MRQNVTPAAAVHFGTVLVVAAVVLFAAGCSDESGTDASESTTSTPPATTTTTIRPPTTTVVEATTSTVAAEPDGGLTEEQTGLVEALLVAFNDQDLGAFLSLFVASPSLTSAVSKPASTGNPERIPIELTYRWAMSEVWDLQDCKIQYGAIDCTLSVSDNLAGRDGALHTRLTLLLDDQGAITKMALLEDEGALNQAAAAIYAWTEENHPEAIEPMWLKFASGIVFPKLTDESIALRLELIPEFLASLDE